MNQQALPTFPRDVRSWLVIAVAALATTLATTYPIWLAPADLINDTGDVRLNTWTLSWVTHSLTQSPGEIWEANIYFPHSETLALSENLIALAPIAAPFVAAGEPVLGYNVALFFSIAAFFITTCLFVRHLAGSTILGVFAATAATFAPSRLDHLPQLQLLASYWIPLCLFLVAKYADTGRGRYAIAAAVALAVQFWTGIQITIIFAPFIAVFGLALLLRGRGPSAGRVAMHTLVAGLLCVALILPAVRPYLRASEAGMERTLEEARTFSTQPVNFLSPSEHQRAPHMRALRNYRGTEANHAAGFVVWTVVAFGVIARLRRRGFARRPSTGSALMLGALGLYVVSALSAMLFGPNPVTGTLFHLQPASLLFVSFIAWCLLGARRDNDDGMFRLCLALAGVAFLVSHGPDVRAWGSELGTGPFQYLFELKPFRSIRAVGRFGMVTSFFLACAAALAVASSAQAPSRRRLVGVTLALAVAGELWVAPITAYDAYADDHPVYDELALLPGTGPIAHVPIMAPPFPAASTQYLLGATRHWRPMVNGYSGFIPPTYVT
ncbi:MAG: hypothetical protein GKS06_10095 [Acidobacteria bacterium]|nr:hypothetical protein [Acidobacteriota bacterium]